MYTYRYEQTGGNSVHLPYDTSLLLLCCCSLVRCTAWPRCNKKRRVYIDDIQENMFTPWRARKRRARTNHHPSSVWPPLSTFLHHSGSNSEQKITKRKEKRKYKNKIKKKRNMKKKERLCVCAVLHAKNDDSLRSDEPYIYVCTPSSACFSPLCCTRIYCKLRYRKLLDELFVSVVALLLQHKYL